MPVSLSYALAGLDTTYSDISGSIRERLLGEAALMPDDVELLPVPDRKLKGDRLPLPPERAANVLSFRAPIAVPQPPAGARPSVRRGERAPTISAPETIAPAAKSPENARGAAAGFADSLAVGIAFTREEADPAFLMARLYFGGAPMGETLEQVKPWEQGEAPNVETLTVSVDTEVTTGALAPDPTPD